MTAPEHGLRLNFSLPRPVLGSKVVFLKLPNIVQGEPLIHFNGGQLQLMELRENSSTLPVSSLFSNPSLSTNSSEFLKFLSAGLEQASNGD